MSEALTLNAQQMKLLNTSYRLQRKIFAEHGGEEWDVKSPSDTLTAVLKSCIEADSTML